MLAAVHATEERLIAPGYMIQIFAHLAFYYIEHELFASKALVAIYWMHPRTNLIYVKFGCPLTKQLLHAIRYGKISVETSHTEC